MFFKLTQSLYYDVFNVKYSKPSILSCQMEIENKMTRSNNDKTKYSIISFRPYETKIWK